MWALGAITGEYPPDLELLNEIVFEQYGIIDVEEVVVNEKGTDSWIK